MHSIIMNTWMHTFFVFYIAVSGDANFVMQQTGMTLGGFISRVWLMHSLKCRKRTVSNIPVDSAQANHCQF